MDAAVIQYYRRLLRTGFEHAGSLENPSIFLDTLNENIPICEGAGNYLHIYLDIRQGIIADIRYLCTCDPTVNVAIEVFCGLARGKTLREIEGITDESFFQVIGGRSEALGGKARGLLELLHRGLARPR